jgi:hypothetical protein
MADTPKNPQDSGRHVESASAAPGEKRSASRPLARAAESGNPEVHKALADLQTVQMNAAMHKGAADSSAAAAEGLDEEIANAQAALADLGFE